METNQFADFLRVLEFYKLKQVPRNSSNQYFDVKDGLHYNRRETIAEHVQSCQKLADYFIFTEDEFKSLDRLRVHDLLSYHDDVEIITGDFGISEKSRRQDKKLLELEARLVLAQRLPHKLARFYLDCDAEYREKVTDESKFANGIDKLDSLVHELQYPEDWGPKGFNEVNLRKRFGPSFEYSVTFSSYFENLITHLQNQNYFNK